MKLALIGMFAAVSMFQTCALSNEQKQQFANLCTNIELASTILESEGNVKPNVQKAINTARVVCATQPSDIAGAVTTLALVYVTLTREQDRAS